MTKRNLFANGLLMMLLAVMLVPAQAQFGWPNSRQRPFPTNDDYRGSGSNGAVVWSGAVDGEVIVRLSPALSIDVTARERSWHAADEPASMTGASSRHPPSVSASVSVSEGRESEIFVTSAGSNGSSRFSRKVSAPPTLSCARFTAAFLPGVR